MQLIIPQYCVFALVIDKNKKLTESYGCSKQRTLSTSSSEIKSSQIPKYSVTELKYNNNLLEVVA